MNATLKNILISLGILLALLSIFLGAYPAVVKARSYIKAVNQLSSIKSVPEFESVFGKALDFSSPIGQEEIVKFLSSSVITSILSQNNPEAVSRALINFIEPYLFKDDVRHLIIRGNLYSVLWNQYRHEEDYMKAEEAYRGALAIGPKLPPVLYSLLDLYQAKGDLEKMNEMAVTINRFWPDDANVKAFLDAQK